MGKDITLRTSAVKTAALPPVRSLHQSWRTLHDLSRDCPLQPQNRRISLRLAPCVHDNGADFFRGAARHLRMPRSADVSASENAGRANRRSAYFISGAACLGIWMP